MDPSDERRPARCWECGSTHHSRRRCPEKTVFKCRSRGAISRPNVGADVGLIAVKNTLQGEVTGGLSATTKRHEANGPSAIVAREAKRCHVSSENGSWLSHEECGNIESEYSSDRTILQEDGSSHPPEWCHGEIEGLCLRLLSQRSQDSEY